MPVSRCGPGASSGPGPYMIVRPRRVVARTRAHCSHARRREDAELVRSVRAHGGGGGVRSITSIERAGRLVAAPRPIPRSLSSEAAGVCQACVRHSLRCGLSVRDGRDRRTERVRERGVIFWQDVRTDGGGKRSGGWVLLGETQQEKEEEEEKHTQILVASQQQQSKRRTRRSDTLPRRTAEK